MASNLSALGFEFADAQAFQETMLQLAAASIEQLDCAAGSYAIWRSRTGAEIWFHLAVFGHEDDARDIAGLTPWYEGESEIEVELVERVVREDDNAFEGAFSARLVGTGLPLNFSAVDFAAHVERALPAKATVRLLGFAKEIVAGAAGSEAPSLDSPEARIAGRVLESRELENEVSGAIFHWLLVDCGGVHIDIVAEPGVSRGAIEEGADLQVACALYGRILG